LDKKYQEEKLYLQEDFLDIKEDINEESLNLIKILIKYENILEETVSKNMPHILAGYSYELTKSFNTFYNNVEVLKEENKKKKNLALRLTKDFSETIKDCFELLAIEMPEKM
jgi:arginyl-tRNA synthetase